MEIKWQLVTIEAFFHPFDAWNFRKIFRKRKLWGHFLVQQYGVIYGTILAEWWSYRKFELFRDELEGAASKTKSGGDRALCRRVGFCRYFGWGGLWRSSIRYDYLSYFQLKILVVNVELNLAAAAKIVDFDDLSQESIELVKREVKIHKTLKHKNIIRFYRLLSN